MWPLADCTMDNCISNATHAPSEPQMRTWGRNGLVIKRPNLYIMAWGTTGLHGAAHKELITTFGVGLLLRQGIRLLAPLVN